MKEPTSYIVPTALAVAALVMGLIGIGWGLPSGERNVLYFHGEVRPPDISNEVVEHSWRYFPEFGWLKGDSDPEMLQGRVRRSAFNPIRSYHPDEYVILKSIANMNPRRLDFNPNFYGWPNFIVYVIAGGLTLSWLVGFITLTTDIGYYFANPGEIARFYVVGRLIVLCFGAGAVAMFYLAAKRMMGKWMALLAGALLVVASGFVVNLHYMTADVPCLFFVCLGLYLMVRLRAGPSLRLYLLTGACVGFCAGMKYIGFLMVLPFFVIHLSARQRTSGGHRGFACALLLSAVCFFAVNPFHLVHLGKCAWIFVWEYRFVHRRVPLYLRAVVPAWMLLCGLGTIPGLLGIGGAVFSLWKGQYRPIAVSALLLYAVMAFVASPFLRHHLILFPFFLLCGCVLLEKAIGSIRATWLKGACSVAAIALLLWPSFDTSSEYLKLFSAENIRTSAGRWIDRYIIPGESIGTPTEPWQFEVPPIDVRRYQVVITDFDMEALRRLKPHYFLVSSLQFHPQYGFWALYLGRKSFMDAFLSDRGFAVPLPIPRVSNNFCRKFPEDMQYVCPDIMMYSLRWRDEQRGT